MGSVPSRGISSSFHRQDVRAVGCFSFFFPFWRNQRLLVAFLLYFCSSLNKKLWLLKESKAERGKAACRKRVLGFQDTGLFLFCVWNSADSGTRDRALTSKRSLSSVSPLQEPCSPFKQEGDSEVLWEEPPLLHCPLPRGHCLNLL